MSFIVRPLATRIATALAALVVAACRYASAIWTNTGSATERLAASGPGLGSVALPTRHGPSYRSIGVATLASALLLGALSTSAANADVWLLGVGNDGFLNDVTGIYDAVSELPNPNDTTIHSRLYANHGGSSILSDITWLADNAAAGDMAMFYYSGHCGPAYDSYYFGDEYYPWALNEYDEVIGRDTTWYSDWCTDDELADALRAVDTSVPVVAIFDTCYAGGMVGGWDDLNSLPNTYVMMSSQEDEVSRAVVGAPYSVFTTQLVNGLGFGLPADTNSNGDVSLDEWFSYAALRTYGQTPVSYDTDDWGSLSVFGPTPVSRVPLPGDADLDGDVDLDDFVLLKRNFSTGTTWGEGDFDSDSDVDLDDFVLLKQNFGANAAVPEPAILVLLTFGGLIGMRRRRR